MWRSKYGMYHLLTTEEIDGADIKIGKLSNGAFYARVLYSGQPLRTVHGILDWIALDDLIDNMSPYIPTDIIALCNN